MPLDYACIVKYVLFYFKNMLRLKKYNIVSCEKLELLKLWYEENLVFENMVKLSRKMVSLIFKRL